MLGQFFGIVLFEEVDFDVDFEVEDDVGDDFVEGLELAAWAIAALPPRRAPEMVNAMRALPIRCRMFRSPPSGLRRLSQAVAPWKPR
jgi:hypothetical protein